MAKGPKWTKPEDIERIQKVRAKQDLKQSRQPLDIVGISGTDRCHILMPDGSYYNAGGRPIDMTRKHAGWYAQRLNPNIELSLRPVFGANSVLPTEKDIFNAGFIATDDVYVVAPGLLGAEYYSLISPDCTTIVVNKAIECSVEADLWLCCEPLCSQTEWFMDNIEDNIDIACFWSLYLYKEFPYIKYTYEYGPPLHKDSGCELIFGGLRDRCTISGQAIQLAYHLGAKRIILVGVDMMGDYYFDKTETKSEGYRPDGPWGWMLPIMNPMLAWIKGQGVEVVSLSETALDIEQI